MDGPGDIPGAVGVRVPPPLPIFKTQKAMEKRFKVVKIGRKSMRRTVLRRNLTEAEARQVVNRYPDSRRSMVVYMAE